MLMSSVSIEPPVRFLSLGLDFDVHTVVRHAAEKPVCLILDFGQNGLDNQGLDATLAKGPGQLFIASLLSSGAVELDPLDFGPGLQVADVLEPLPQAGEPVPTLPQVSAKPLPTTDCPSLNLRARPGSSSACSSIP